MKLGGTPYGYGYGWQDNQSGQDGSSNTSNLPESQALFATPGSNVDNNQSSFAGGASAASAVAAPTALPDAAVPVPGLSAQVLPSSTTQTVSFAGNGLVFNNTFSGSATNANFETDAVAAETYLASQFKSNVTVNVSFTVASINPAFSAENSFGTVNITYQQYVNALRNEATSAVGLRAVAALSNLADPSNGAGFFIPTSYARMLGLGGNGGGTDDSLTLNSVYFTTSTFQSDPGDTEAVILHELSEGSMGRIGSLGKTGGTQWAPMDLFRYNAQGQRDFTGGSDGVLTYFSPDGTGVNTGLQFHNSINAQGVFDGFDLADWDGVGADANNTDPFGPGGPGAGDPGTLSATDIAIMQALGWNSAAAPPPPTVTEKLFADTGVSATDNITSNPEVTGTGAASTTVTITEGSNTLGTATSDANGNWTFTPTGLADGTHTLVASETNAGGTGTASLTFTLDTTPPSLVHDTGLAVTVGATVTITASMLDYTDNISSDAGESYTIVQPPGSGQLLLNGTPATSFTQADIDNGAVSYKETSPSATTDDIVFQVSDVAGNTIQPKDFAITVGPPPPPFGPPTLVLPDFGTAAGGWVNQNTFPRLLGDVNGDKRADIVAFGNAGVFSALGNTDGTFQSPNVAFNGFGFDPSAGGWTNQNLFPRELADVNGDGRADIVAFGDAGVFVSFGNADGTFQSPILAFNGFGFDPSAGGWTNQNLFPRELADVNGDGRADIVAFGDAGTFVSLGNANGTFQQPIVGIAGFGFDPSAGGWSSQNLFPRELADVNGDGRADIVAFGDAGVYVSLGNANGTFQSPILAFNGFGLDPSAGGWSSQDTYPRLLADVNGDGRADIVAFGAAGVYVALGNADGTFQSPILALSGLGTNAGFSSNDIFPREMADVNGDGRADIVAFANNGVYVALANPNGTFQPPVLDTHLSASSLGTV